MLWSDAALGLLNGHLSAPVTSTLVDLYGFPYTNTTSRLDHKIRTGALIFLVTQLALGLELCDTSSPRTSNYEN